MGKIKQQLDDLKPAADGAGDGIDVSMTKARGSLMLVEAAVGVRLPRALNSLIASIPGISALFQAMLPLAGIAAAIAVVGKLVEAHEKLKDEAFQAANAQKNLGATIGTVLGGLQDKLLQAGIRADDLNGNHLGALKKTLELIDHQSLDGLAQSFDELAKAADASMATMQIHWWQVGSGSAGAKHSLAEFQAQYELLLKTGKGDEANKALDEKVARERQVLAIEKELAATDGGANIEKHTAAVKQSVVLTGDILESTKQSIEAEQTLVDILNAEVQARSTIRKTASVEKGTAVNKDNLTSLSEEAALQKLVAAGVEAHSQALIKMAEAQEKAKTTAGKSGGDDSIDERLAKQKAAIEEEKAATIAGATAEWEAKRTVYDADIKAAGANVQKKKEIEAEWANTAHAYVDSVQIAEVEANAKSVAAEAAAAEEKRRLAEGLAQSKAALDKAYAELSLSQIMTAIKKEQDAEEHSAALGLSTERQQLTQKLKIIEQERDAKVKAIQDEIAAERAAASASGSNGDRAKQNQDLAKAAQLQAQLNTVTAEYASQVAKVNTDMDKLNASWTSYFGKMKVETQDLSTTIKTKLQAAVTEFETQFGNSMAKAIVENKSLGEAVRKEAGQMLETMISTLVQWLEKWVTTHVMATVMGTSTNKAAQASAASLAGANMVASYSAAPFPLDMAAPAMGAMAAASAMSFEIGGKIPGSGPVPITGHGGETVVTKALTDRVEASEARGGRGGGGDMHVHFAPQIHAMDAEGLDRVLTKHSSTFERHFRGALRRMNK